MAIGAAITANARVIMSKYLNNPDYVVYYTDTDSIYLNKPLPDKLVHNSKLGLFKLERVLTKFISIGPKVYGGIDLDGNEFTKVKGFKNPLSVNLLEILLQENIDNNNSIELIHEKWSKHLTEGFISVNK